jgi:RHS repeat-associated protein
VVHQKGTLTLDGASYTVDNAGNRQSRTALPGTTATNFTYDAIYELLTAKQGSTTKESYTYDPVGNRLSALGSSGWSNNSSNELTSRPGVTYTYDSNGNMLTSVSGANTTHYTWDFENRLTSVQLPGSGGTVSFKYDAFGRRVYKSSSSTTSIYAYDGDNLIEETNSAGTAVARYTQGLNIDEPLAMLRGSTTSYYSADGLGSVTSLTNTSGANAQTYTYDSFGNLTASSGSLTNSFRYTAREFDAETGLYFYRARYYDPASGRFISQDPIEFNGGNNFYAYVKNGATNLIDPKGLCFSDLLRCAAALSQAGSLSNLTHGHIPTVLGSNTVGDIVGLLVGPEPGTDPALANSERVDQVAGIAADVSAHVLKDAAGQVAVGIAPSVGLPVSSFPGVYNPVTVGETAITLEATRLGSVALKGLNILGWAKLGADALVFAEAMALCGFD